MYWHEKFMMGTLLSLILIGVASFIFIWLPEGRFLFFVVQPTLLVVFVVLLMFSLGIRSNIYGRILREVKDKDVASTVSMFLFALVVAPALLFTALVWFFGSSLI